MLIERAEVEGRVHAVRIDDGRVVEIADRLDARPGEPRLDANGGALIPGLMLVGLALTTSTPVAVSLWLGRGLLSQMDIPARDALTMTVVQPSERVAMASVPPGSIFTPRIPAERSTIRARSTGS